MKKILVVAPHPDDETLGCGGTILKHIKKGDEVHWLIVTKMSKKAGFSKFEIDKKNKEIEEVGNLFGFKKIHQFGFHTTLLDQVLRVDLVNKFSRLIKEEKFHTMYLPFRNDAHSDHKIVYDSAITCAKSFRYKSIKSIFIYETLSETEYGFQPGVNFVPNLFVDISNFLKQKIKIMNSYKNEISDFPFPRSKVCIESLAKLRGSMIDCEAAEAFMIVKIIK